MINEIIHSINQGVKERALIVYPDSSFQSFGLSFPIITYSDDEAENGMVYTAVIDDSGECHHVFSDDDYAAGWYHRITSKTYGKTKGFGLSDLDVEIVDIVLVCWGFRNQLKILPYDFEAKIIIPALPKEAAILQSDFDQFKVFQQEFKKINYNIIPEEFLFATKYRVQYTFDRMCVEIH